MKLESGPCLAASAVLFVGSWSLACSPAPGDRAVVLNDEVAQGPAAADPIADVRARADLRFAKADMVKPPMEGDHGIDPYLAPIFYRETGTGGEGDAAEMFGTLVGDAGMGVVVDAQQPTVYFERGTVTVGGAELPTLTYRWFYGAPGEAPIARGVRITLDGAGLPALFELLDDTSGLDVIYGTIAVEEHAGEAHGAVARDRVHALERPLDDAPDTVVAGLTKAGPMALGPFLYLGRGSRDVLGLHCRCEPSRVDELGGNLEYALAPMSELAALGIDARWPRSELDTRLRLPDLAGN